MTYRILFTGARKWMYSHMLYVWLEREIKLAPPGEDVVLVHGGATGADMMADREWRALMEVHPNLLPPEIHPASGHKTPLIRNEYMVGLGANRCMTAALDWASGTGHCARTARKAGIPTRDYGASTQ